MKSLKIKIRSEHVARLSLFKSVEKLASANLVNSFLIVDNQVVNEILELVYSRLHQ